VFEQEDDTPILTGAFTKRVGQIGNYRAKFEITNTNGFIVGNFYSVVGLAIVGGVLGKCICLIFRCGPTETMVAVPNSNIYNVNVVAAQAIADEFLDRDMAMGWDSGTSTIRTVRQALRILRNKWYISGGVLYVCKENDSEESWTAIPTTSVSAEPITGIDPAS
jgi:hypothetical protein